MIEIKKWPVVIFTNYRTGSTALGTLLGQQYNVPYFDEPAQNGDRQYAFLEFIETNDTDKYVIKFMADQIDDLPIYAELLAADNFKIRLLRNDVVAQSVSYYIAMSRQAWTQEVEEIQEAYEVAIDMRAMSWAATAIHQNNTDLIESTLPFDEDLIYENLDLRENGTLYRTTQPSNLTDIKRAMYELISAENYGHYNAGWRTYGHQDHVAAQEQGRLTGYSVDWYYRWKKIDPDVMRTMTRFTMTETRPSTDVEFWPVFKLPDSKRIWGDNSIRMEVKVGDVDHALEGGGKHDPFTYKIIPYTRIQNHSESVDSLTRITEYDCVDNLPCFPLHAL